MDVNNWRGGGQVPMVEPQAGTVELLALLNSGDAPPVDPDAWRAHLPLDCRQRIVDKVTEVLTTHIPFSGQEGLQELKRIAVRFEERIYSIATSQSDYLRKISVKMITMEKKYQSPTANSLQPGAANASRNPSDLGSSVVLFSISIGESEIVNAKPFFATELTYHTPARPQSCRIISKAPLAISITITIA